MVGDGDDEKPDENGGSTRATSVETQLGPATQDPPPPEKAETQARLTTCTIQPTTEPVDRPISLSVTLPQHSAGRVGGADDLEAAVVANPSSASPLPLSQPSSALTLAVEEEWEIRKIVSKRRVGRDYAYKVRWKDTWLHRSELGNARGLLKEFEARGRLQRGPERRRPARAS